MLNYSDVESYEGGLYGAMGIYIRGTCSGPESWDSLLKEVKGELRSEKHSKN